MNVIALSWNMTERPVGADRPSSPPPPSSAAPEPFATALERSRGSAEKRELPSSPSQRTDRPTRQASTAAEARSEKAEESEARRRPAVEPDQATAAPAQAPVEAEGEDAAAADAVLVAAASTVIALPQLKTAGATTAKAAASEQPAPGDGPRLAGGGVAPAPLASEAAATITPTVPPSAESGALQGDDQQVSSAAQQRASGTKGDAAFTSSGGGMSQGAMTAASAVPTATPTFTPIDASSSSPAPPPVVPPSSAASTAPPPPAAPLNAPPDADAANVARVARGLASAVQQRGGAVTLRLQPPELGMVRVELNVRDNIVQAVLTTEHDTARSLLQAQINQLRGALESQGLHVERLSVQSMPPQSGGGDAQAQTGQGGNDGRSRGAFSQAQDQPGEQQRPPQGEQRVSRFEQALNAVA